MKLFYDFQITRMFIGDQPSVCLSLRLYSFHTGARLAFFLLENLKMTSPNRMFPNIMNEGYQGLLIYQDACLKMWILFFLNLVQWAKKRSNSNVCLFDNNKNNKALPKGKIEVFFFMGKLIFISQGYLCNSLFIIPNNQRFIEYADNV